VAANEGGGVLVLRVGEVGRVGVVYGRLGAERDGEDDALMQCVDDEAVRSKMAFQEAASCAAWSW